MQDKDSRLRNGTPRRTLGFNSCDGCDFGMLLGFTLVEIGREIVGRNIHTLHPSFAVKCFLAPRCKAHFGPPSLTAKAVPLPYPLGKLSWQAGFEIAAIWKTCESNIGACYNGDQSGRHVNSGSRFRAGA